MDDSSLAIATWLGTLARAGVVVSDHEAAGQAVAANVVGEESVARLREWLEAQTPETRSREQEAAIEGLIHMALADRELHPDEESLLFAIIENAALTQAAQKSLVRRIAAPGALEGIAERLTHPVLRELLLAMGWEMALADGRIDPSERTLYDEMAILLEIRPARANELREALHSRVLVRGHRRPFSGSPPG